MRLSGLLSYTVQARMGPCPGAIRRLTPLSPPQISELVKFEFLCIFKIDLYPNFERLFRYGPCAVLLSPMRFTLLRE